MRRQIAAVLHETLWTTDRNTTAEFLKLGACYVDNQYYMAGAHLCVPFEKGTALETSALFPVLVKAKWKRKGTSFFCLYCDTWCNHFSM